jgi:hypothetical protein
MSTPNTQVPATELTFEQKVEMFRRTATDPVARANFAASRADIINPLLYNESTVRAIFKPTRVPRGATMTWDVPFEDIECTFVMPQIGGIPTVQVEGAQLSIDTFGIDGGIEYQMDIAADGRFDVGTLATTQLKQKFIQQEELCGWNLIKAHAAVLPAGQIVSAPNTNKFDVPALNKLITTADQIGVGGRRVTDVYVSPGRFGDLRDAITSGLTLPDSLKTQIWGNGQGPTAVADIRIHKVYSSALIDSTAGYAFTQKDGFTYGIMPIRDELTTRDNPIAFLEWKIGIVGRERVGFGILDDKGLVKITF